MSELKVLSQKIDSQAKSSARSERLLEGLLEQMTTFVAFEARAEERLMADREQQKRVEAHQDKQDTKIDQAQATANEALTQANNNAKWINGAWGVGSFIIGIIATILTTEWMGP